MFGARTPNTSAREGNPEDIMAVLLDFFTTSRPLTASRRETPTDDLPRRRQRPDQR
jgi:hypothetical protein